MELELLLPLSQGELAGARESWVLRLNTDPEMWLRGAVQSGDRAAKPRPAKVGAVLLLSVACGSSRTSIGKDRGDADAAASETQFCIASATVEASLVEEESRRATEENLPPDPLGLTPGEHQAVVAVVSEGELLCSGVLIAPRHAITVDHCLDGSEAEDLFVAFGSSVATPVARRTVTAVHVHPRLDAALLTLGALAPDAAVPISLADDLDAQDVVGHRAEAGGFGRNPDGTLGVKRYFAATVSELGRELHVIGDGAPSLCSGDSGAPLLGRDRSGRVATWGVLRGGSPGCLGPDTFVRADRLFTWATRRVRRRAPNPTCTDEHSSR